MEKKERKKTAGGAAYVLASVGSLGLDPPEAQMGSIICGQDYTVVQAQ